MPHSTDPDVVFPGASELATRMRATDWSATPLGPLAHWPAELCTAVGIVLTSRFAMWMAWGDQLPFLYNDVYARETLGKKHPWALGRPAAEVWSELWHDVEQRVRSVLDDGASTWDEHLLLYIERGGKRVETYHTFSYSPLRDGMGAIRGLLCVVVEETPKLVAQRRVSTLATLAGDLLAVASREDVFASLTRTLAVGAAGTRDLPFTISYLLEGGGEARLVATTGFEAAPSSAPPAQWPLGEVVTTGAPRVLALEGDAWPRGPWPARIAQALVMPLGRLGVIVLGLNPMSHFDDAYRDFASLFVGQLAAQLASAGARAEELRRARERDRVFEQAPVAIVILRGRDHVFEIVNPTARALLGDRDLVGLRAATGLPEALAQGFVALLDQAFESGVAFRGQSLPFQIRGADGAWEEHYVDFIYQPMFDGATVVGIAVIAHDVTALATARLEAVAANRAKDEFLAMLGHELRNPLAPITSALQLMRTNPSPGAQRERDVIERQVRYLVGLVDDLLDISRITRGSVDLAHELVDLADIADDAVADAKPLFAERGHALECAIPRGLVVHGDAPRLKQVLLHLLTNAAKYTPEGGRITLTAQRDATEIVLTVADSGIGIEPDLLGRVFDMFAQAPQSFDRKQGGLGLGLAIVANLVRLHGGTVTATSAGTGQGSQFEVRLPSQAGAVVVAPRVPTVRTRTLGTGRILIVDDNVEAGELLGELLASTGYDTRVFIDGPSALAEVDRFAPDVAILDLGLPGMDGIELASALRARPGLADLKFIAATGYGLAKDRQRTSEAGFVAHLLKPVDIGKLRALVERLTEHIR